MGQLRAQGHLTDDEVARFEQDVEDASSVALARYATPGTRTRPSSWFAQPERWTRFERTSKEETSRRHLVFIADDFPPNVVFGIARVVHQLATGLAELGHVVRVLVPTPSGGHRRVDLVDGVWVHRVPALDHGSGAGLLPESVWRKSRALVDELHRIDRTRPVDVVQVPNWDSLGADLDRDRFSGMVVVGLYTPLAVAANHNRLIDLSDHAVQLLLSAEVSEYERADALLACGEAVVEEVEQAYGVHLDRRRIGFVPHGLTDESGRAADDDGAPGPRVLFVGRLEGRKGIDVLLEAVPEVLRTVPDAAFDVVGEDVEGVAARWRRSADARHREAVVLHGKVADQELYEHYAHTSVVCVPSRYESFGLPIVEGMMFGKPSVVAAVGGMVELVTPQETGLLFPVGDAVSLAAALVRVLRDDSLRSSMGAGARQTYERRHTRAAMCERVEAQYETWLDRRTGPTAATSTEVVR